MQDTVQTKTNIVPAWQVSKGKRDNESILIEVDPDMKRSKVNAGLSIDFP